MKHNVLLFLLFILFASGYSQEPLWTKITDREVAGINKVERNAMPSQYELYSLNKNEFTARLQSAPLRGGGHSSVILSFPAEGGKLENFRVYEAPVMHSDLSALHPEIKSYVGQGVENPLNTVRFSVTPFGVHTLLFTAKGSLYTDPYTTDLQNYIVYKKSALKAPRNFGCEVLENTEAAEPQNGPMSVQSNDGVLRIYRLAMACTSEYAAFHVNAAGLNAGTTAQKKAAVLAAMNVTMTRINGVYERDMSLTMQLVPDNEDIIFIGSDNFNNNNAGVLINQSQSVIDNIIGFNNYDIGHTVSTGGGGLAVLGCVCTSSKARGITGSPFPVGDPFDIDYVAHEMGHQFGANHTFNNSGQRNANTAVEPGSGSTIMAYAGISPPNVQNNSDDYFHTVSITQMINYINGNGGFCAQEVPNNNSAPFIPVLPSYTIPRSTAFVLRGSATDDDDDAALTYNWEQVNANGASSTQNNTPSPTSTSGPNFRSLPSSESPDRYIPNFQSVLNGDLTPTWEVVPSVSRTLNFALTVRDNQVPDGGQTARRNTTVTVSGAAGPFTVTSQSDDDIIWEQDTQETITWDVAGTTGAGINAANVNILLSTDGGQTFDTVLVANTPNDGSEAITVPDVEAPFCRIIVEAADNIFYAVNSTPFSIGVELVSNCETFTSNDAIAIPDNAQQFSASFIEVPDNGIITEVNFSVDITHTYVGDLVLIGVGPDDTQVVLLETECTDNQNLNLTFSDGGSPISCSSPVTGTVLPAESLSAFNGISSGGEWILAFLDTANQDTGTLNSWSVEVCTLTSASVDSNGLNSFKLYPNPNTGSFTVSFNSASSDDIKVNVHDMRGREVFNQTYENTGLFSGNINLGGIQTGVYMVTVQDGAHKEVQKIIVK